MVDNGGGTHDTTENTLTFNWTSGTTEITYTISSVAALDATISGEYQRFYDANYQKREH